MVKVIAYGFSINYIFVIFFAFILLENCFLKLEKKKYIYIYTCDFANYWQAFVSHALRFGYYFVSVYYHLKERYVNFFIFFLDFLNYFTHP